jgi:hypothetical protein
MKKIIVLLILLLSFQANTPSTAWDLKDEKSWLQKRDDRAFDAMDQRYQLRRGEAARERKDEDEELRKKYEPDDADPPDIRQRAEERYETEKEALDRQRKIEDDQLESAYENELRKDFPDRWNEIMNERARKESQLANERIENESREADADLEQEREKNRQEWDERLKKNQEGSSEGIGDEGESGGYIEWVDKDGNFRREEL